MPLLERVTIALLAVLSVATLVAIIKYDMQRIAASQPATRAGTNSTPIRCPQLRRLSGCAAAVAPTLAVTDLLGRVARFQLAQRVVDRGKGYRDAVVLKCLADLGRSHSGRCHRLQDLLDNKRVGTASRASVLRSCRCGSAGAARASRLRGRRCL